MDEFEREARLERAAKRVARQRVFWLHAVLFGAVNLLLVVVWGVTGAGFPWFVFPLFGWLVGLAAHGAQAYLLRTPQDVVLERSTRRDLEAGR